MRCTVAREYLDRAVNLNKLFCTFRIAKKNWLVTSTWSLTFQTCLFKVSIAPELSQVRKTIQ